MSKEKKKVEFTEKELELMNKYARKIVRRRLEAPAIFMLESFKPMNFVGSQMMLGAEPLLSVFINTEDFQQFQKLLERRESIEKFLVVLEGLTDRRENGEKI